MAIDTERLAERYSFFGGRRGLILFEFHAVWDDVD